MDNVLKVDAELKVRDVCIMKYIKYNGWGHTLIIWPFSILDIIIYQVWNIYDHETKSHLILLKQVKNIKLVRVETNLTKNEYKDTRLVTHSNPQGYQQHKAKGDTY